MPTILEKRIVCDGCDGKGWYFRINSSEGIEVESGHKLACTSCGGSNKYSSWRGDKVPSNYGSGYQNKKFEIGEDACPHCEGGGRIEFTEVIYGKNIFGQDTRNSVDRAVECPSCFGRKVKLYEIKKKICGMCDGKGDTEEWCKSFFGGEVKRKITCTRCKGSGRVEVREAWPYKGTLR